MTRQSLYAVHRQKVGRMSHAPGHLRDAFCKGLEAFRGDCASAFGAWSLVDFRNDDQQREWLSKTDGERAFWLLEQLQDCRDILPGDCRQIMEDRFPDDAPSTYGSAARVLIRFQMASDKPKCLKKIEELIAGYRSIRCGKNDTEFNPRFYKVQAGCIDLLRMIGPRGEHWRAQLVGDPLKDPDAPLKTIACLEYMKEAIADW